jgi:hypothetical protein
MVPAPLYAASFHFRTKLAEGLEVLSDRMAGQIGRTMPDLQLALTSLEETVSQQIHTVSDSGLVAHIRARLTLYQEAVAITVKLTRLSVG